jgi:hypothetical protein
LAVDSSAHLIIDLADVSESAAYRSKILQIESMGGGIFVYEALSHAAKMISTAEPQTKHIILFADAADSEEPGNYRQLLAECANAGITVSVIGLGKATDVDAPLLEEIAALGQGRCFFTESAAELPRLFAQDTFVVARSSFLEDPTQVDGLASMLTITGRQFDFTHPVGGYNLCYLRDGATQCAVSIDEYQAPIMAAWQSGIGRTLCYTPQVDGPFTGDIVQWPQIGPFLASMANWVAGNQGDLGDDIVLTQRVQNGVCRIELHLDPQRDAQHVLKLPKVTTLSGYAARSPQTQTYQMGYVDADTLALEFGLQGAKTYLSTVEIDGIEPVTLPPVTLPYSPEFKPIDRSQSATAMAAIAEATGGTERIDVAGIWDALPAKKQFISLVPWLIGVAAVLFLLEVFQRRTGLLAKVRWDIGIAEKLKRSAASVRIKQPTRKKTKSVQTEAGKPEGESDKTPPPETERPKAGDQQELFDAMSRAQKKAQSRTRRQ